MKQYIDLTHTLNNDIPSWDAGCGFAKSLICDYEDCTTEVKVRVNKLAMPAGIGTHMDAPSHMIPGASNIDQLPLEKCNVSCVVIDISAKANAEYQLSVADIEAFEVRQGKIQKGVFVMVYTGWEKFWLEPEQYRNNYHFPSVSVKAAEYFLQKEIVGLGIDTLSPDCPHNDFHVHRVLLGAGCYIIENIANSKSLPPTGASIIAFPLKIEGGTESPIRLVGVV